MQREESYEEQIRDLTTRLKDVSFSRIKQQCINYMIYRLNNVPIWLNVQWLNCKRKSIVSKVMISYTIDCLFYMLIFFADELLAEKEKYKGVSEELDMTLNELSGY